MRLARLLDAFAGTRAPADRFPVVVKLPAVGPTVILHRLPAAWRKRRYRHQSKAEKGSDRGHGPGKGEKGGKVSVRTIEHLQLPKLPGEASGCHCSARIGQSMRPGFRYGFTTRAISPERVPKWCSHPFQHHEQSGLYSCPSTAMAGRMLLLDHPAFPFARGRRRLAKRRSRSLSESPA